MTIKALKFPVGLIGSFSHLTQCSRIHLPTEQLMNTVNGQRWGGEIHRPSFFAGNYDCLTDLNCHSLAPTTLEPLPDRPLITGVLGDLRLITQLCPDVVLQAVGTPCLSAAVSCEYIGLSRS